MRLTRRSQLRRTPKEDIDWSGPLGTGTTAWRSVRKAAGLPAVRFHDGRHTANTTLALIGWLGDPTLRAHEHPKPTPRRCYLTHRHRTIMFDAKTDRGLARRVPPEAYRRFCDALRARTERNRESRARELGIHDEKDRLIAEWVAARGTPDQQDRHAAGMLSIKEVLEGMADEAFAAAGERPRYVRDGISRLESYLRQLPQYAKVVVTKADFLVTSANAEHANEAQWTLKQELEKLLPDATLTLRLHRLSWTKDPKAPTLTLFGVLVTRKAGPFTLRREHLAPER